MITCEGGECLESEPSAGSLVALSTSVMPGEKAAAHLGVGRLLIADLKSKSFIHSGGASCLLLRPPQPLCLCYCSPDRFIAPSPLLSFRGTMGVIV